MNTELHEYGMWKYFSTFIYTLIFNLQIFSLTTVLKNTVCLCVSKPEIISCFLVSGRTLRKNIYFFKINLFLERGRERGRETSMCGCLAAPYWQPSPQPRHVSWLGIGNITSNPLVPRLALNPLNHTCQGWGKIFKWD